MIETLKDLMQGLLGGEAAAGESREIFLLAELSQAFAQSLDIEETLRNAADHLIEFLDAEASSVFLLEGDELVCRASAGPAPITGLRLPKHAGIVGKTLAEGGWKMVRDVRQDPAFYDKVDSETHFKTRSIMCTVLQAGDRRFGVIEVLNKRGGNGLFSEQDLQVLRVLGTAVSLAVRNAQMAADLVAQNRLRRELDLARELQQQLQPAPRPEPFPLAGINLPAHEVSGDFYDYFDVGGEVEGGRIGFTIGDVSGKGLNAALLMVRTTSLLRALGRAGMPLPRLLGRVNAELCETGAHGMFVCVFAGIYDPRTSKLTWANAGFPPGLYRTAGGRYQHLGADAPPLGVEPETVFHEHQLQLGDGALYLYTDGVTEAHDADGRPLDEAGLRKLIELHAGMACEQRLPALVQSLRDLSRKDDTTLLLLQGRKPSAERLMDLHLPAQPESLRQVREAVSRSLRAVGCSPEVVERTVLALDEACANVIRHGYRGAEGLIDLALERRGQELVFLLRDYAEACNPLKLKPKAPSRKRPGGLGLHFIDTIMDHWEHRKPADGRGNLLVMSRKIG